MTQHCGVEAVATRDDIGGQQRSMPSSRAKSEGSNSQLMPYDCALELSTATSLRNSLGAKRRAVHPLKTTLVRARGVLPPIFSHASLTMRSQRAFQAVLSIRFNTSITDCPMKGFGVSSKSTGLCLGDQCSKSSQTSAGISLRQIRTRIP